MSMDLEVWSENPFDLESILDKYDQWDKYGDELSYEGDGWQVTINLDMPDQPPNAVIEKISSAKYVAYTSLEPIGADANGYRFFEETVRALARGSEGLWVDAYGEVFSPNEGSFY
jgi:hypothetical protein